MSNIQSLLNLSSIVPGQVGNNPAEKKEDVEPVQKLLSKKDEFNSQNNSGPVIHDSIVDLYKTLLVSISSKDEDAINQTKEKIDKLKSAYKKVTGKRFTLLEEDTKLFEKILSNVAEKTVDVQNKLISAISSNDSDSIKALGKQLSVLKSTNAELKKMLGKPEPEKTDYPKDVLDKRKIMIEKLESKVSDLEKQLLKAAAEGNSEAIKTIQLQLAAIKAILGALKDFAEEGEEKKKFVPPEGMA